MTRATYPYQQGKTKQDTMKYSGWLAVCLLAFALLLGIEGSGPAVLAQQAPPAKEAGSEKKEEPPLVYANDDEVKLGRENAEANDKQVKLVTDPAMLERVNRIGQEIAAVANRKRIKPLWGITDNKNFRYTFKIVDEKDVNAYSLPGGFIYINKGLLDYVRSDDELAGVLAHEIVHAAHHHMVKLMREQRKIQNVLLPLLAAVLITGRGEGAPQILLASQLYTVAKINTYGIEAEKDSDHAGMILLTQTRYNPVGLYSFMLRLAAEERFKPYGDLGIYRTHPPGAERAASAKELLEELGVPVRLSEVDPTLLAAVRVIKGAANGEDVAEIVMRGVVICRVAAAEGKTAEQRAVGFAKRLTSLIDARLQPFDVRLNKPQTCVMVRGVPMLTEADAAALNKTMPVLAREMAEAVALINQKRQLDNAF